jgi:hypothetical protein
MVTYVILAWVHLVLKARPLGWPGRVHRSRRGSVYGVTGIDVTGLGLPFVTALAFTAAQAGVRQAAAVVPAVGAAVLQPRWLRTGGSSTPPPRMWARPSCWQVRSAAGSPASSADGRPANTSGAKRPA